MVEFARSAKLAAASLGEEGAIRHAFAFWVLICRRHLPLTLRHLSHSVTVHSVPTGRAANGGALAAAR